MQHKLFGINVYISFWFLAAVAVSCIAGHGAPAIYILLPIAVHELGHLIVMGICGAKIKAVLLTIKGIKIQRKEQIFGYGAEIAIVLGGVVANIIFAVCLKLFCFQSMRIMLLISANIAVVIFNLMPIGDLDGGQLLKLTGAHLLGPDTAQKLSKIMSVAVLAMLFGFTIFLITAGLANVTLLAACVFLTAQVISCEF